MIDGSEKRNRRLAFELENSHVCESTVNTHGSREAVSHLEKAINVQGSLHFDTPSQSSPCTTSRGDNMITTFISN